MKNFMILAYVLIAVCLAGVFTNMNINRYQIVQHNMVRADKFLIDTKTGKTWQIVVDPSGESFSLTLIKRKSSSSDDDM